MLDQLQVPLGCRRSIEDTHHYHVRSTRQVRYTPYHVRSSRLLLDVEDRQEIHTIIMLDQLQAPLGRRRSIGDTHHYHVRSTLGSFGTQKIDRRYTPLSCQINSRLLWDVEDRQEIHTIIMLDQLQAPLVRRRSIGDTHHYHVRSTLGSFGTQKIDRRYTPLPCQINSRLLWDVEDRQETHTIIMLDQLQAPLGRRRSIGDTHHYHVRSTLVSFGTQKIDRRYTPLSCQINSSVLWDVEDRQEIHTIIMLDQLQGSFGTQKIDRRYTPLSCQINSRLLWDVEDRQEIHTIIMLDQLQAPLGRRRSIGDTHHYHVRSTLVSSGNRRSIGDTPLSCQINFRSLWDVEDRQEIHTITMLDQVQAPLGRRRSIGNTHHYHVRSTLGSFGTQKIDRRYTPLSCQIHSRLLWDVEDRQEIHTIIMLDQLQAPLGRRRSIGNTQHYHVRSTLGSSGTQKIDRRSHHYHVRSTLVSFGTQKIDKRYTPSSCQINSRLLWDVEDRQEIHTIIMLDPLQAPLGRRRIDRRYTPLSCQINSRLLWDVEDRQEIHTIIMLDQLQAPLGRRRS